MRNSRIGKPKVPTNEKIREIKKEAQRVYESPFAYYELPHNVELKLTDPNPSTIYSYYDFTLKVVDDDELNALVVTWIAAQEKAKRCEMILCNPKKIIFHWGSILKPSSEGKGKWTFSLREIVLEDSVGDEIVFLLDGMDSRKKVMYAPFNEYRPRVKYDPFERANEMMKRTEDAINSIIESKVMPPGPDYEAAVEQTRTIQVLLYEALVTCYDILDALVKLPTEQHMQAALFFLK